MAEDIVAIVDDDEAVRQSTSRILERAGFQTIPFSSGDDFLGRALDVPLSCILLDLHMPGADGLAVLAALRDRGDAPSTIVITAHGDLGVAIEAMKRGACDFIEKPYEAGDLLAAIRAALEGNAGVADANAFRARATAAVDSLTPRQRQVLLGILKGLPNKIIAYELDLSIRTVETYRAQLLEKLNVRGTAEAVRLALAAGLGEEPFGRKANGGRNPAAGVRG